MSTQEIAIDALLHSVGDGMPSDGTPKYLRLVEAFSDCVISGRFKPGERVPTETSLAEKLPVSVGTVQKALARLVSNGLVVRHRRTGTFIADRRSLVNEVFVYRYKDPDHRQTHDAVCAHDLRQCRHQQRPMAGSVEGQTLRSCRPSGVV